MPLRPKDIGDERDMALATTLRTVLKVQEYILGQLPPLSDNEAHRKHVERHGVDRRIMEAHNQLQVYFFGD